MELSDADLPEQAEQVVGSDFNRQIRHQRSRKPPGTKYQLEILGSTSWVPPPFIVHCKKLDSRSALRTRGRCEQHASRSRRGMHCEFIIQTGFSFSFIFSTFSFVIFIIIR